MTIHFAPLIKRKQAITYIDDTIMQAQTENEMFEIIENYHLLLRKAGLKAQPEKTKFFLRKVQFLGQIVGKEGIQPVKKRVADLKALKSPENKRDVMRVLGCLGFYSMYIKNLHVDCKPFYDLTKTETKFEWTAEHEKLFQSIKDRISEDTILAIPDTKHPFHVHVDASSIGVGSILVQEFPEGKRIVSFNSRIYTKEEQKMSTTARELCGVISALQTYEHYIIGSPFPVYVYTDHKPLMYLWGRQGKLSHRFFRYQLVISQFQNLKIIWTEGKNLAFPDILSRNVELKDLDKHQLKHKKIPKDISFYDQNGNEEKYFVLHDNEKGNADDFYPILKETKTGLAKYTFKNDQLTQERYKPSKATICGVTNLVDYFSQGSAINHFKKLNDQKQTATQIETNELEKTSNNSFLNSGEANSEKNSPSNTIIEANNENFCQVIDDPDHEILTFAEIFAAQNAEEEQNKTSLTKQSPFPKKLDEKMDAKELILKLTSFAKNVDLNTEVLCEEQLKDPVLQQIRKFFLSQNKDLKTIENRQSKAITNYLNNFENLCIIGNLLCIKEQTDDPNTELIKVCVPISLFIKTFNLAHDDVLAGHIGLDKTLANIRRFFHWPGMYKWVKHLIASCLDCQKNKKKRKDIYEAPLEKWTDTIPFPFHTVHIDHKGPLNPPSNGKHHCLVIVDSFSRFIQVYPVRSTDAFDTIKAFEKFILSFGIPQKLVYDKGSAFMNQNFTSWIHELGITPAPRTAFSPWTNGKVEIQNKHLGAHFRMFLEQAGGKWDELAPKFAFAHNTVPNSSTGISPYEIIFGQKPQIPLSLKLGLLRNSNLTCNSDFCKDLPLHRHTLQKSDNKEIDKLLKPKIESSLLSRENQFKQIYNSTYKHSLAHNAKAHKHRNKHKLGKQLEIGQKVLMENHSIELGKSKKLKELRSGPYTVVKKITNVNYEIELDNDKRFRNVAHRNHLVEYYPAEETLPDLTVEYGINNDSLETFYENLRSSQLKKLNTPVNRYSFQIPMQTEFWPITDFDRTPVDLDKTPTNFDSGFIEGSSSGAVNEHLTNRNIEVIRERTRSSTPHSHGQIIRQTNPEFSPLRSSNPHNNTMPNPSNNAENRRVSNRRKQQTSRYQAGFT